MFLDAEEVRGFDREVEATAGREVAGVAGTFFAPTGLAALGRVVEEVGTVVRFAGVAATVLDTAARSEVVDGARDILFGLADMPSLPFSSPEGFSSMEPPDGLF